MASQSVPERITVWSAHLKTHSSEGINAEALCVRPQRHTALCSDHFPLKKMYRGFYMLYVNVWYISGTALFSAGFSGQLMDIV